MLKRFVALSLMTAMKIGYAQNYKLEKIVFDTHCLSLEITSDQPVDKHMVEHIRDDARNFLQLAATESKDEKIILKKTTELLTLDHPTPKITITDYNPRYIASAENPTCKNIKN